MTEKLFKELVTVRLAEDKKSVEITDQTLLPSQIRIISLRSPYDFFDAIKKLKVRGAPAIGVTAALGMAVMSNDIETDDYEKFLARFCEIKEMMAASRPTAVNLFWALERMEKIVLKSRGKSVGEIKALLYREAESVRDEDININRAIGEYGFQILEEIKREKGNPGILTHCNAGTLATAMYGTATSPMYTALEKGWSGDEMRVYCDETRPLLQGARITALELSSAGICTYLQCDGSAYSLMKEGKIDAVFVGCDRVAANGDVANKVGTGAVAVLAKYFSVPFYVCAPSSTIDLKSASGELIPIEMRQEEEITTMWFKEKMAPDGIEVYNPAFDVTESELISGIITEKGILRAPYIQSIKKVFGSCKNE